MFKENDRVSASEALRGQVREQSLNVQWEAWGIFEQGCEMRALLRLIGQQVQMGRRGFYNDQN